MIPVVFLHVGSGGDILEKVFKQAKKNNRVILIGDDNTSYLGPLCGIEFVNIQEVIDDDCKEFGDKLYDHLSTNPEHIEKFCFLRWFVVRTFMRKFNFDRIFHADSDVMLYCDVTEENKKYEQFDMTLIHRACGSTSYMSVDSIDRFCNYLIGIYRDKTSFAYDELRAKFNNMRKHNKDGGVCDMTLLERFHYEDTAGGGPCRIGEMSHVFGDATFDHNINVDDGVYEHNGQHKSITFKDGIPYCFHKNLNKQVRFNGLHFQGPAKRLLFGDTDNV